MQYRRVNQQPSGKESGVGRGKRRLNNVEGRLVREIFSCSRLLWTFRCVSSQKRIDCSFGEPGKPSLLASATTFKEKTTSHTLVLVRVEQ